jgi:NRPS condensation-like uncharacterized protein
MRIPFNVLDESFVHMDDPVQPPTVQMEARVASRLDDGRVRAALGAAAQRHPLARARVLPWRGRDPHPEWQVDEFPQLDSLRVLEVDDEAELDAIRGGLLSTPVSLFESPPWRARLVHAPVGDVLMLSVHHAASDGMGCLRLLQSVLRAYAGVDDPIPGLDPLESHSLAFAGQPTELQRGRAWLLELQKLRHLADVPARVAPDGAADIAGYGVVSRRVPAAVAVESPLRRRLAASVNDLLLAVLHMTIDRWNTARGGRAERIAIQMPINARPAQWKSELVGNMVTAETVSTTPADRTSPEACLAAVAGWTNGVKDRGPQPAMAFLAGLPTYNIDVKRNAILSAIGGRWADTSVLSNVGRVAPDWVASRDLVVEEVLFSPPTAMPLGVGLGAAATDQWLSLSFRHRPALLDSVAARKFSDLYLDVLAEMTRLSP